MTNQLSQSPVGKGPKMGMNNDKVLPVLDQYPPPSRNRITLPHLLNRFMNRPHDRIPVSGILPSQVDGSFDGRPSILYLFLNETSDPTNLLSHFEGNRDLLSNPTWNGSCWIIYLLHVDLITINV